MIKGWTLAYAYAYAYRRGRHGRGRRLHPERETRRRRLLAGERSGLSLAAGMVWPVILLGVVEIGSFAIYAKFHERDDEDPRVEVPV